MFRYLFLASLLFLQAAGGKPPISEDVERDSISDEMKKMLLRHENQIQQLTQILFEYKEQLQEYSIIQENQEKQLAEYKEQLKEYKTTQEMQGKQLHNCRIAQILIEKQIVMVQKRIMPSKGKMMKNSGIKLSFRTLLILYNFYASMQITNPELAGILIPNPIKVTVYITEDQWSDTMP